MKSFTHKIQIYERKNKIKEEADIKKIIGNTHYGNNLFFLCV